MRQKELRIALVCYGGVSLAVYMHGVTKELWKLARASRNHHGGTAVSGGTEAVYLALLQRIERQSKLRLKVLTDIIAGALDPSTDVAPLSARVEKLTEAFPLYHGLS